MPSHRPEPTLPRRRGTPAALALIAAGLAPCVDAQERPAPKLAIGAPAPKLDVQWLRGEAVDPASGDHVVVVECWSTWCPLCVDSIPHLTRLQARLGDKGLRIAAVAVWDQRAHVEQFVKQRGADIGYAVAFDHTGSVVADWLKASGHTIPTAFVVGRDGHVAWIGHPLAGLDEVVEEVLAGTYDLELARRLQAKEREVQEAFQANDWARVMKIADEVLQLAPARFEPWAMKYVAATAAGRDPAQVESIARGALQALAAKPRQLATFVRHVLLRPGAGGGADNAATAAALPVLERALQQNGARAELHVVRVLVLDTLGKEDGAVAAARVAIERLEPEPHALVDLAANLAQAKSGDKLSGPALVALRHAAKTLGDTAQILQTRFQLLLRKGDHAAAKEVGLAVVTRLEGQSSALNNFAWRLLTEADSKGRYVDVALAAAEALTRCEGWRIPAFLDTVALAKFESGQIDAAIALQRLAIERGGEDPEYHERLARYQQARADADAKEEAKEKEKARGDREDGGR